MAVQAQYPSNILLFNRNVQDGNNDYSLQSQAGGLFLDQSHLLFNNGGSTNTRKRGREVNSTTDNNNTNNNYNNNNNNVTSSSLNMYSSMQSRPPQLIDLALLHITQSNNNGVSTGLKLSFGDQQKQQQQLQHHHHQNFIQQSNNIYHQSSNSTLSLVLSEDFDAQIKQQTEEIEQLLHAQAEQLQRTLAEKRQRQYRALLSAADEVLSRTLREKEAEVETATRKNAELQTRAAQLSAEVQIWQAKARAQEAAVVSLQAQIQQAIIHGQDRRADNGSGLDCTVGPDGQAEDAESVYIDPDRVVEIEPSCKTCRKRIAAVLVLPCRHLSLCTVCDQVVQSCPVCLRLKSSSLEVYFS